MARRAPDSADTLIVETLLTLYAEAAGPQPEFERDRPPQVSRAIHLMREAIDTDAHRRLELSELAQAAGVFPKHLCRLFRASIGHSPVQTHRLLCL